MYTTNSRGLPGMFAPVNHESVLGYKVRLASSCTSAPHAFSASGNGSMVANPCFRMYAMQFAIQSPWDSVPEEHVKHHRGRLRAMEDEQIGKTYDCQAQVGAAAL